MNDLLQYTTWGGIVRHWKALGGVAACIYNPPLLLKGRTLTTTLIFPPPAGAMMGGYEGFSLGQCLVYRMDIVGERRGRRQICGGCGGCGGCAPEMSPGMLRSRFLVNPDRARGRNRGSMCPSSICAPIHYHGTPIGILPWKGAPAGQSGSRRARGGGVVGKGREEDSLGGLAAT